MFISLPTFHVGGGPDKLLLTYNPESILELARTIEVGRKFDPTKPDKRLATELFGTLEFETGDKTNAS